MTISGSNTFHNLKDDRSVNRSIEFTAGTTQTISSISLNGTSSQGLTLKSTTNGSTWSISGGSGYHSVNAVTIQDSVAIGGATFVAFSSIDNGNNSGWEFITPSLAEISSLTNIPAITI